MPDADRDAVSTGRITFGFVEVPIEIRQVPAARRDAALGFFEEPRVESVPMRRAVATVGIAGFVERAEIDLSRIDEAYVAAPLDERSKGYALLHEMLQETSSVGVAKVVLRTRQRMAVVVARGPALALGLLRRDDGASRREAKRPSLASLRTRDRELTMAERIVDAMIDAPRLEAFRAAQPGPVMRLVGRSRATSA